jgi:lysozyme family protein
MVGGAIMANFNKAFNKTLKHEGGYSNDPDDVGGETYKGVARRYHPSWQGWYVVDKCKHKPDFPDNLKSEIELDVLVKNFYKANYWDVNLLDEFTSQELAEEMFDTGVNMGVGRAAKYLQKALNLLNKNGSVYADIAEDGAVGSNTLKALGACVMYRGDEYIYKIMNILQGMHYIKYMTKSPTQEKYAYGWLKRVNFIKGE